MASVLAVTEFSDDRFLVLLTRNGYVKKTAVSVFKSLNARGKRIIGLDPTDELKWVRRCTERDSLLIASQKGFIIRFSTDNINLRASGRSSRGVRAMRLYDEDEIADMDVIMYSDDEMENEEGSEGEESSHDDTHDENFEPEEAPPMQNNEEYSDERTCLVAVTRLGTGKRVRVTSFKLQARGGVGVRAIKLPKKGDDSLVAMQICHTDDSMMVVTRDGTIVRTRVGKIPVQSRYSRGVRIQRLGTHDTVAAVAVLPQLLAGEDEGDDEAEEDESRS